MPLLGSRANAVLSMWNGVDRFALFHLNEHGKIHFRTWRKMNLTGSSGHQIERVNRDGEITPCCCFSTIQGHVQLKRLASRLRT
jgi:hypothetical protein